MGIALISTYPPRRCGIASVALHLRKALLEAGETYVPVVALVQDPSDQLVGPEVVFQIQHHRRTDYLRAAEYLNALPVRAIILEHEFTIFGGTFGSYVLDLLMHLHKPVITVFHTVPANARPAVVAVVRKVAARSAAIAALCERARGLLTSHFRVPAHKVVHLPNGAPLPPAETGIDWKTRLCFPDRTLLMTLGLITPTKGIETALHAVAQVAPDHPELLYLILGATHPNEAKRRGDRYLMRLQEHVAALGIGDHVQFVNRYLSEEEVLQYLMAADMYVTPYLSKEQTSSATLAQAAFLGKALLSTPYDYAEELLAGGAGYLFPFGDSARLADGLRWLLDAPEARRALGQAARARAQEFAWPALGQRYRQLVDELAPPDAPVPSHLPEAPTNLVPSQPPEAPANLVPSNPPEVPRTRSPIRRRRGRA